MNRRDLFRAATAGALVAAAGPFATAAELPEPTPRKLPRWRGFNLLSYFMVDGKEAFPESDFAAIADWGFDFTRLPMDYRCWTDSADWTKIRDDDLKPIDAAVAFGRKHGVHTQLNFHRAPGFTVASPAEKKSLWTDAEALDVCTQHWVHFAKRYQGVPSREVSFNLVNEPTDKVTPEQHRKVVEHLCQAIRGVDPGRLIVCDGRAWGNIAPTELVGLDVAAALHGYQPMAVTHYKASWAGWNEGWPKPVWPLQSGDGPRDKEGIRKSFIEPWKALEKQGVGVHVGEFGCHNQTPHEVVLAWMRDVLGLYREAGWGWTLWNLRGSFGVMDSDRKDVKYVDYQGRKLDKAMLETLQAASG